MLATKNLPTGLDLPLLPGPRRSLPNLLLASGTFKKPVLEVTLATLAVDGADVREVRGQDTDHFGGRGSDAR